VYEAFDLNSFGFNLCKQRNQKEPLISTRSKTVSSIGLSHGDMLYLVPTNGTQLWSAPSTSSASNNAPIGNDNRYNYMNYLIEHMKLMLFC